MTTSELQIKDLNDANMRDKVFSIEKVMLNAPDELKITLEVKHYFSSGVYARELFIPKGIVLTGHIHKYSNLNIVSKGRLLVLVNDRVEEIAAPYTIVSPPGIKRIAFALEDTIWTTIHGTDEIDVDKIEQHFVAHTELEYVQFCKDQEAQLKLFESNVQCLTLTPSD